MPRPSFLHIASLFFFIFVVGLLGWRRFDMPKQEPVTVVAQEQSKHQVGDALKRGMVIETGDGEFLTFRIGTDVLVSVDQRSRIELTRLFEDERVLRFTRGRIVVRNTDKNPLFLDTNKTENVITQGEVIFINYDFQQMVTVAPIKGGVQTHVKGSRDYLLVPSPINISETDPFPLSQTTVDTTQGPSAPFHAWTSSVFSSNDVSSMIPPPNTVSP